MNIFYSNKSKWDVKVVFLTFAIFTTFITLYEIYNYNRSVFAIQDTDSKSITLGIIAPDIGDDRIKVYKQLTDSVNSKIGQSEVKLIVANTTDQLVSLINKNKVDLYAASSIVTALINNRTGAIPLLTGKSNDDDKIYTLIITKKVTGPLQIFLLADLIGKKFGITDTSSGLEYLLPKSYLLHYGLTVNPLPEPPLNASKTNVNYVVTNNAINTTSSILSGKLGAGAISIEAYKQLSNSTKSKFKIIGQTIEVPSDIISYRQDVNSTVVTTIKNLLLNANIAPSNSGYLKKNFIKFVEFKNLPNLSNITKSAILADLYNSCDPIQIFSVQDYCK